MDSEYGINKIVLHCDFKKVGIWMIIILANIPDNTGNQDIEDFIRPAVKDAFVTNISIMAQKNTKTHEIQFHGLITIVPDSVAKEVIKKLDGNKINGRHVDIHEYQVRYLHNDPRVSEDQFKELSVNRQRDRRSRHLEIYRL